MRYKNFNSKNDVILCWLCTKKGGKNPLKGSNNTSQALYKEYCDLRHGVFVFHLLLGKGLNKNSILDCPGTLLMNFNGDLTASVDNKN